jgi:AraC-like DNA-binding protein
MNDSRYIWFFLGILGAFNGLILGLYLIFLTRKKTLPNLFLGCLLLALSIRIGKSVFVYFNPTLAKIYLQVGLSACFFIGPMLYFYVRSSLEQLTTIPARWKWQLAGLLAIIVVVGILYPYADYPQLWRSYIIRGIYGVWLIYIGAAVIAVKAPLTKLFSREAGVRSSLKKMETWVLVIVGINIVIFASFFLALIRAVGSGMYFSGSLIFSFVLYAIIFVLLYRKKPQGLFDTAAAPTRSPQKKVSDDSAAVLLGKLEQVMTEQEMFKNPNLTLSELAKAINISSHQLSQVLNDNLGKNFTSYINEYRINKACSMIAANHPFSLEAIGYEVGFNSKSTFYSSFKKLKATTPSLYKENLSKSGYS